MDEILKCDYVSYWTVLCNYGAVCYEGQGAFMYKVVLTFESVDKILTCDHACNLLDSSLLSCCLLCCTR